MSKVIITLKTRRDVIYELRKNKLPSSIPFLNKLENEGVIQKPTYQLNRTSYGSERLYTEKDLQETVEDVKSHIKNRRKPFMYQFKSNQNV